MTSITESTHQLEIQQIQLGEGPCIEAYRDAEQVGAPDVADAAARWPRFAPEAMSSGFRAVHALPLRLRAQTIGALNLVTQLESALNSRIVIEQAKGRLLERGNLPTAEDAFALLRGYARRTNQRLTNVAESIMNNTIDTSPILAPGADHQTR